MHAVILPKGPRRVGFHACDLAAEEWGRRQEELRVHLSVSACVRVHVFVCMCLFSEQAILAVETFSALFAYEADFMYMAVLVQNSD